MLQLIILGQIPGTQIQLTFAWFQVIVLPLLAVVAYKLYRAQLAKVQQQTQRHFDVISLRNLDQA